MKKQTEMNAAMFTPKTKKTVAKKTAQAVASKIAAEEGSKAVAKLALKTGTKFGAKGLAKGMTNPWLLAADGVDFGARKVCESCDVDEDVAKAVGKGSGLLASMAIGAGFGGPIGFVGGALLWGIGEGVSAVFEWD